MPDEDAILGERNPHTLVYYGVLGLFTFAWYTWAVASPGKAVAVVGEVFGSPEFAGATYVSILFIMFAPLLLLGWFHLIIGGATANEA